MFSFNKIMCEVDTKVDEGQEKVASGKQEK